MARRSISRKRPPEKSVEFDAGLDQACRLAADDVARELGAGAAREVIAAQARELLGADADGMTDEQLYRESLSRRKKMPEGTGESQKGGA